MLGRGKARAGSARSARRQATTRAVARVKKIQRVLASRLVGARGKEPCPTMNRVLASSRMTSGEDFVFPQIVRESPHRTRIMRASKRRLARTRGTRGASGHVKKETEEVP
jgi:hypothetical protein